MTWSFFPIVIVLILGKDLAAEHAQHNTRLITPGSPNQLTSEQEEQASHEPILGVGVDTTTTNNSNRGL